MKSLIVFFGAMIWILTVNAQCTSDADCNLMTNNSFCNGLICVDSACIPKPAPCTQACNEELRQCVECNAALDCPSPQMVCSDLTHKCSYCKESSECPQQSFCTGGQEQCISGLCKPKPPSLWPCQSIALCNEDTKSCYECESDTDCGAWDICSNPRVCNATLHQCIANATQLNCASQGKYCDPVGQSCVECRSNSDCIRDNDSFCKPQTTCDMNTHQCFWDHRNPCPTVNNEGAIIECNEYVKGCVLKTCLGGTNAECSDGNECNGNEQCTNGLCYQPSVTHCPQGYFCSNSTQRCSDSHVGLSCVSNTDCRPFGLICRIVSKADASLKVCIECRTHAQCSDGDASNGEEQCDSTTRHCVPGTHPCQGLPSEFVYNPLTGKCDKNTRLDTLNEQMTVKSVPASPAPTVVSLPRLFASVKTQQPPMVTVQSETVESWILQNLVLFIILIIIVVMVIIGIVAYAYGSRLINYVKRTGKDASTIERARDTDQRAEDLQNVRSFGKKSNKKYKFKDW